LPSCALGVGLPIVLSLAVSLPARRFKGDFFVLVSLVVQTVLISILTNWTSSDADFGTWHNFTNGPYGLIGIPRPVILGVKLDSLENMAVLSVGLASLCVFITWMLVRSPWGRLLKCIRDDELAAMGLGKNVRSTKIQAVALGCGMAALGGAIYASYVGFIDPSAAAVDQSVLMLSMVIVGGAGNLRGPLVGATVLVLVPEILRFIHIPDGIAPNIRLIAYGVFLVLLMHFRPQGIAGDYRLE
jgi:branched-chain amino acid transport system permease protein